MKNRLYIFFLTNLRGAAENKYFDILWLHLMVFSIKRISAQYNVVLKRPQKNRRPKEWKTNSKVVEFFLFLSLKTPYSCYDHHSRLTWKPFQNFLHFLSAYIRKSCRFLNTLLPLPLSILFFGGVIFFHPPYAVLFFYYEFEFLSSPSSI